MFLWNTVLHIACDFITNLHIPDVCDPISKYCRCCTISIVWSVWGEIAATYAADNLIPSLQLVLIL